MRLFDNPNSTAGKMTVSIVITGFVVFVLAFLFDIETERAEHIARAQSDNATTTVTVLNTPPIWTVDVEENPESSTSSPTSATSSVEWAGTGTDSNADDYWLIVCDSPAAATPNSNAPPTCAGGTWGISPTTTSGTEATSTYLTLVGDAEVNDWYASICDADVGTPQCNTDIQQGSGSTASPFHVNHRPVFEVISNDSPGDPGVLITWTSSSSDQDSLSGDGTYVYVCKTADFDYATPGCTGGASDTWATSSHIFNINAEATTTIAIPTQDDTYDAYVWVVDDHNFAALNNFVGGTASNSPLIVNNVAPTVSVGDIFINYGASIILGIEQGETTGFVVQFEVADNNSCVANASTTSEFNAATVSVFRTGVGLTTGCDSAADFDTNNCYITDAPGNWNYSAIVATTTETCTGPLDRTQDYQLTFPLWYNADPTDGASLTDATFFADNWSAAVHVSDDDLASSTVSTTTSPVELLSFLAFDLNNLLIPYGPIAPGNTTTPIIATTTIEATGNVGIDQGLEGEDMCTDYTGFDTCYDPSPTAPTSTILVAQQVYATSSIPYADTDVTALSAVSTETEVDVLKTTVTTTPATGDIIWGIAVPASIILSGAYEGQNTFTVIKGEAEEWQ